MQSQGGLPGKETSKNKPENEKKPESQGKTLQAEARATSKAKGRQSYWKDSGWRVRSALEDEARETGRPSPAESWRP